MHCCVAQPFDGLAHCLMIVASHDLAQPGRRRCNLGFLFFFVSHGLLHWAEQSVPSGVAALVIAIEPAIVALMLPALRVGPSPTAWTWAGLALGAIGVGVLFGPDVTTGVGVMVGLVSVLVSAIAWSLGIVYARKIQPRSGGATSSPRTPSRTTP